MSKRGLSRREFLGGSVLVGSGLVMPTFLSLLHYRQANAQSKPLNAAMSSAGLAGTWNAQGKVAHTWGQQGHTGAQGRAQGFYNIMKKNPDIQVVDDEFGDWDVAKVANIWQSILNKHPDLTGGFCHNDDMALSARKVVEDA